MSFGQIRREYKGAPLDEAGVDADPFRQFERWFDEIAGLEPDPTAMALATTTTAGQPSARMVLLKGVDARGFVFYTNYESRKADEIAETGRASLLFYWPSLERQIRVEGVVAPVASAESDAYFASRPLESRWGVYASRQSHPVTGRAALEAQVEAARRTYGADVPRPPWWGGYRVAPHAFEFWQGRPNRLHDRVRYSQDGARWRRERLAP